MRKMTEEHHLLKVLDARMQLTGELQRFLKNLEKGHWGECDFDLLLKQLKCKYLVLKNVRLKMYHNYFQIDTLLITGKMMIVFEIKNWGGAFDYVDGQFVSRKFNKPYKNPLEQLERCVTNLRYLLKTWGFDFEVVGRVIFMDPTFYLYQVPAGLPFLFRPELGDWVEGLNQFTSWVNDDYQRLAEWITMRNQPARVDRTLLPSYNLASLRKGVDCQCFGSLATSAVCHYMKCDDCGGKERIEQAIVRQAESFVLLFPERPMTSALVKEFCGHQFEQRRIQRILTKNFEKVGTSKGTFYRIQPFAAKK